MAPWRETGLFAGAVTAMEWTRSNQFGDAAVIYERGGVYYADVWTRTDDPGHCGWKWLEYGPYQTLEEAKTETQSIVAALELLDE